MPREGHDFCCPSPLGPGWVFLSTCPVRGTTRRFLPRCETGVISIHVPREGHDYYQGNIDWASVISIHVPREGHDAACQG